MYFEKIRSIDAILELQCQNSEHCVSSSRMRRRRKRQTTTTTTTTLHYATNQTRPGYVIAAQFASAWRHLIVCSQTNKAVTSARSLLLTIRGEIYCVLWTLFARQRSNNSTTCCKNLISIQLGEHRCRWWLRAGMGLDRRRKSLPVILLAAVELHTWLNVNPVGFVWRQYDICSIDRKT